MDKRKLGYSSKGGGDRRMTVTTRVRSGWENGQGVKFVPRGYESGMDGNLTENDSGLPP